MKFPACMEENCAACRPFHNDFLYPLLPLVSDSPAEPDNLSAGEETEKQPSPSGSNEQNKNDSEPEPASSTKSRASPAKGNNRGTPPLTANSIT